MIIYFFVILPQQKSVSEVATFKVRPTINVNMKDWIDAKPEACFEEWKNSKLLKTSENDENRQDSVNESSYLSGEWLRNVIFAPSCGTLRQVACSIVETICQVRNFLFVTFMQSSLFMFISTF